MADEIKRLVFSGTAPTLLIRTLLAFGQGVERLLPCALADAGIGAGEICFGNLQVEHGLTQGLIPGFDNLPRFLFVVGMQTGPFAGRRIDTIEGAAAAATAN